MHSIFLRATEHLKHLSATVFPALSNLTLQPIRAQLAAFPDVKELLESRARHKAELDAYRHKVHTLRKAAGLPTDGAISESALSSLPSNVSKKLLPKMTKLSNLTQSYERMSTSLTQNLIKYVNSKDMILNLATKSYLETMQDYASKNLLLHTQDVKLFLKNLQATEKQVREESVTPITNAAALISKHRKSNSTGGGSASHTGGIAVPGGGHAGHSYSTMTLPNTKKNNQLQNNASKLVPLLPLQADETDDIEEAELNPLVIHATHVTTTTTTTTTASLDSASSPRLTGRLRVDSQPRHSARRLSMAGMIVSDDAAATAAPPPKQQSGDKSSTMRGTLKKHDSTGGNTLSPGDARSAHKPSYSVMLYNNPPFLPFSESFASVHERFSPRNVRCLSVPAAIETTSEALRGLSQPKSTNNSSNNLPLQTLVDATAPRPIQRTNSLDTKSHLLGSAAGKNTIPIVSTAAFLQQHRTEQMSSGPSSRRTSAAGNGTTIAATATATTVTQSSIIKTIAPIEDRAQSSLPPISSALSSSLGVPSTSSPGVHAGSPASGGSCLSSSPALPPNSPASSNSSSILSVALDDDDDDFIPPPPAPIDWDQLTDSSEEDLSSSDDDDDEFGDHFLTTPRSSHSKRATSFAGTRGGTSELPDINENARASSADEAEPPPPPPTMTETETETTPAPASAPTTTTTGTKFLPLSASSLSLIDSSDHAQSAPAPRISVSSDTSSTVSVASSAGMRSKPILTGKFAALSQQFGAAAARTNTPTAAQTVSATGTAVIQPSGSSDVVGASDATPLPILESSPLVGASVTPASAVSVPPLALAGAGGDNAIPASLQADFEAVLRLAAAKDNTTSAATTSNTQNTTADNDKGAPTGDAAPTKATFRSPFTLNQPAATRSPFTIGGQAAAATHSPSPTHTSPSTPAQSQPAADTLSQTSGVTTATCASPPNDSSAGSPPAAEPPTAEIVVALYDYTAQREIELSFKAGGQCVMRCTLTHNNAPSNHLRIDVASFSFPFLSFFRSLVGDVQRSIWLVEWQCVGRRHGSIPEQLGQTTNEIEQEQQK